MAIVEDILPCTAMVIIEMCTIFLTIMASTAMSRLGMSSFVFVVYTNALSSVILLPFSYFYHRKDKIHAPLFTFPILSRVFLLGLLGVTIAQNLAFAGLSYSSPIVACGMANMVPALTFILAIFLRKISIDVKSQGSQARMIGTVISIIGGMSMTYYKGPVVKQYSPLFLQLARPRLLVFTSTHENWVLGCFLFATASLALCAWNIIQAGTIRKYPQVMKIVFLYTLFGTIQSAIFAFVMEKDLNAWRLKLDMELLVIVLTGSDLKAFFRVSSNVKSTSPYSKTAQSIWKQINKRYGIINGTKVFDLKKELASISQGEPAIASYFTKLKKLWHELGSMCKNHSNKCTCVAKEGLKQEDEENKLYQFLMGLNDTYVGVRSNMLMMNPLPSLDSAYNILLQDETQQQVSPYAQPYSKMASFHAKLNFKSFQCPQPPPRKFTPKDHSIHDKTLLTCKYCKKPGHCIDQCYKLYGFSPNFKFTKNRKFGTTTNVKSRSL
ncbi:hypothetical protein FXO37_30391 [Capsicum annuum]|nr:hypothetical protein FXO37_30391 [Capsicum annuum]